MHMEKANATLRFLRMSPRKVRLVVNIVRGMDLEKALAQLSFNAKDASEPVKKLIESAAANAVNNHGMSRNLLFVETITVDDGPTLKRFMPRAQGRATTIRKRSSHVNVILAERVGDKEAKQVEEKEVKMPAVKKSPAKKADTKQPVAKKVAEEEVDEKKPSEKVEDNKN